MQFKAIVCALISAGVLTVTAIDNARHKRDASAGMQGSIAAILYLLAYLTARGFVS